MLLFAIHSRIRSRSPNLDSFPQRTIHLGDVYREMCGVANLIPIVSLLTNTRICIESVKYLLGNDKSSFNDI